jgi:hypothetical protein
MTTSAAFNPVNKWRNTGLLLLLAFLLAGCIQPDAPYPGGSIQPGTGTPIFAPINGGFPTLPPFPTSPSDPQPPVATNPIVTQPTLPPFPTIAVTTAQPGITDPPTQPIINTQPPVNTIPPTVAIIPTAAGTPEPAQFIWGFYKVGPEQVAIMFYVNPTGTRCLRYIYRNKAIERCPQPGESLVAVTGVEPAADNNQYTIVAGRTLNGAIRTIAIEFADGTSQSLATSAGGFIAVFPGVRQATRATPIDQNGNLVGAVVPIR